MTRHAQRRVVRFARCLSLRAHPSRMFCCRGPVDPSGLCRHRPAILHRLVNLLLCRLTLTGEVHTYSRIHTAQETGFESSSPWLRHAVRLTPAIAELRREPELRWQRHAACPKPATAEVLGVDKFSQHHPHGLFSLSCFGLVPPVWDASFQEQVSKFGAKVQTRARFVLCVTSLE